MAAHHDSAVAAVVGYIKRCHGQLSGIHVVLKKKSWWNMKVVVRWLWYPRLILHR